MKKYILKRVLLSILILFFVTLIIYTLIRCLPTSYIENIARQKSMQPGSKSYEEWMEQLSAMYNLDTGILTGFFRWWGQMLRGNFGDSWVYTIPVTEEFNKTIWLSFVMGLITMFFEIIIAVPLGIIAATKQYSKTDYTISVIALAGISLPTFFFASLLKLVFSVKLGWFDLFGLVGRNYEQLDTNMLEVLNSDYIRTARAKGLSERKVIYHHAFRNTLIPLVTIIGGSLPGLFSGALITETLYAIPGIGYASYKAMVGGDIPFSMFYLTFLAILTLLGNLISDILYAVVDPRVRIS